MQVDVKVNPCVEDVEVLITAEKKTQFVNDLVEVIWDFDKHTVTTLTGYIDNRAYIIKVADILRIFALNQKVYIQTANAAFLIKYRLYEIEDVLKKQKFLRISNSEIVNIRKIADIDLSIIGRVCIRLSGNICVYVSRRYIPKIKKSLGQHRANGLLSRKSIPTMNHDRDTPLKCLHVRTDSSCQAGPVSQNQIRKCE